MKMIGITVALVAGLSACSWVDTQPGAERVALIDQYQAESCQRIGTANSETLEKLWFVARDEQKVHQELLSLARNRANNMGGNALLPVSPQHNGKQAFVVYRCTP